MKLDESLKNEHVLNRICEIYGFTQKLQLARHFDIAASSLQNRYSRGAISYDFAAYCSLETGANLKWILTGEGDPFPNNETTEEAKTIPLFTLSEEILKSDGFLFISDNFFSMPITDALAVKLDKKLLFIDKKSSLSDGLWMIDIEGGISVRELTKLPGRKLYITGGKVPFECSIDDIKPLGRVIGTYLEGI